jgi:hypothetical protein
MIGMGPSLRALLHGAFDLAIEVNFGVIEDSDRFLFETLRRIKGTTETSVMVVPKQIV